MPPMRRVRIIATMALAFLAGLPGIASAQSLIRDAEIERSLAMIAAPLFRAAGLNAGRMKVLAIQASSMNAFVIDDRHVFLHSGMILRLDDPEELQAVIGHEIGHIVSGHLARRRLNISSANTAAKMGLLLSLAAAAAAGPNAGAGVLAGTTSASMRNFLSHSRAEETAADQVGVRLLAAAGSNPGAAAQVMELFAGQEALSTSRQDVYLRSHPLSRERLRNLRGLAAAYADRGGDVGDNIRYWHARLRAKMEAFIRNPSFVLRKTGNGRDEISTLRRAIAYHRLPDKARAQSEVNRLIAMRPNDPFYHELKGQFFLETGNPVAAVKSYERAVALLPRNALLLAGLGRSLLAVGTTSARKRALQVLTDARNRDPQDPRMLRDLAVVYAKSGNAGMASVVTAERYALIGRFDSARSNASRAQGLLPRGSPGWLRAQDVIIAADAVAPKRKRRN